MNGKALDLSHLSPGFSDPSLGAQEVFRHCLRALAHPGTIITLEQNAAIAQPMMPATGALALSLLDQDTSVWLSPGLSIDPVIDYLRFHTGCRLANAPADADFALIHSVSELPVLALFCQGNDEFPEESTTVVLQIAKLGIHPMWTLSGPGIPGQRLLSVDNPESGVDNFASDFVQSWQQNHQRFPCGIDLFFTSGQQLSGLPRSTRLSLWSETDTCT